MSVLPKTATLLSFFIVLAVFLTVTFMLGLYLQNLFSSEKSKDDLASKSFKETISTITLKFREIVSLAWLHLQKWVKAIHYFKKRWEETKGYTNKTWLYPFSFLLILLRDMFILLLGGVWSFFYCIFFALFIWKLPLKELEYGLKLFLRPRTNILHPLKFSLWLFIKDLFRLILCPLWIGLCLTHVFGWAIKKLFGCFYNRYF
jgi:hypothetical protein